MLSYIKKDFLILKKDSILFIPMIIIFSVIPSLPASFLSSLYSVTMTFTIFTYEEKDNTNGYLCALPNGRKNMVISKYLLFPLISIILTLITTVIPIIISLIKGSEIIYDYNFIYVSFPIVVMSIVFPLIYLIGANRARIFLFIIFFGTSFIIGYISKLFPEINKIFLFLQNRMYLVFVFSFIMYVISFFISMWVNNRKDY